jgi:hypothetical protein
MVSINYSRLFNLKMTHNYFEDNSATDLFLKPTQGTIQILSNARMLFKTIPNGMTVLYRAGDDEITPMVELSPPQRFTFTVAAESPARFQNITRLDVSPTERFSAGKILYFRNEPTAASTSAQSPETLTHSLLDGVRAPLFSYAFTIADPATDVLLRITGPNGNTLPAGNAPDGTPLTDPLPISRDDDGEFRQQIDLRQWPEGRHTFTIRSSDDSATLFEETFFISEELLSQQFVAIVDINYSDSPNHLYGDTEEYSLSFSRKETIWTYYIVNKNGHIVFDDHDLEINDPGSPGYPAVSFGRTGDEPHGEIKVNGFDTVVFKSDLPIPFRDIPKPDLQLIRNPGGAVLVKHLPNPSHSGVVKEVDGQTESEVFVFI